MKIRLLTALTCSAVALMMTVSLKAEAPKPPKGFTALFNGKDFSGWHGMPHFDPNKLTALSPEERSRKLAEWSEEFKNHWKVENGELDVVEKAAPIAC